MKTKYKTDNGGFATRCDDIKLFYSGSTWNTRLSQIAKTEGKILIMTNGFPKELWSTDQGVVEREYIYQIFDKRPRDIFIICNSSSMEDAKEIKSKYPEIAIRHNDKMNAKAVLIEPDTVMFSSADFGHTKQIELGAGFHSAEIYSQVRELFANYWKKSKDI